MKYLILALTFLFSYQIKGQVVKVEPIRPTSDKEFNLIFDLNQSADPRAKKLLGKTDDVYLWSGAGSNSEGNPFEFSPKDQIKFSKPNPKGKLTYLGNNLWSIRLRPRTYFSVPDSIPIKILGLVIKSGNGRAQTENFIIDIYKD